MTAAELRGIKPSTRIKRAFFKTTRVLKKAQVTLKWEDGTAKAVPSRLFYIPAFPRSGVQPLKRCSFFIISLPAAGNLI
jgi:hypothetical protein